MIKTPEKIKNYCTVCNEVARRKDLSARAKGIYYYLATLPDGWKLSQTECMKHFTEGRDSFTKAFNELIKAGYIIKTKIRDDQHKFSGVEYQVLWTTNSLSDEITPDSGIYHAKNAKNDDLATKPTY